MRIGVGALLGITGGPATYARELVRALARAGGHEYVVFTDRPPDFAGDGVETVHVPLASTYHQVAWDHARLPGLVRRAGVALYHGTKGVLPLVGLRVPGVVTVHDLAVYACPETFARAQRWHFRLCVPPSVARAARVIADSAHARDDRSRGSASRRRACASCRSALRSAIAARSPRTPCAGSAPAWASASGSSPASARCSPGSASSA
jgi:hypothetical protein